MATSHAHASASVAVESRPNGRWEVQKKRYELWSRRFDTESPAVAKAERGAKQRGADFDARGSDDRGLTAR